MLTSRTGSAVLGRLSFIVLATGISLVLAQLSWNLFEKHFVKLKDRWTSRGREGLGATLGARERLPAPVSVSLASGPHHAVDRGGVAREVRDYPGPLSSGRMEAV